LAEKYSKPHTYTQQTEAALFQEGISFTIFGVYQDLPLCHSQAIALSALPVMTGQAERG